MPRASYAARVRRVAMLVVVLAAAPAAAIAPLHISADVEFADAVRVAVTIENASGEEARALAPQIRHRLLERDGEPVTLPPGARHTWRLDFPLPGGPRGDALIVLARWQDARGRRRSLPWVRAVDTPGLLPTEAQLIVDTESAAGREQAGVRISNATPDPLRARLVAVIPEEFFTTPVAQPVEVPPRQTVRVPVAVQSHGERGYDYPVYAILQFEQGGVPRVIVGTTTLEIGGAGRRAPVEPLIVGSTAVILAVGAVVLASRQAARRRAREALR
jgi:hypothetical protein